MWIRNIVEELQQKYSTRCPYTISDYLKKHVLQHDLHHEINGFYKYDRRNQYIVINKNLEPYLKKFVCAHELGHATLHPRLNTPFMRKNTLLSVNKIEREANRFAAELLIPDENLFNSYDQMTIYDIASIHQVPVELVKLKYKGLF